MSKNEEIRSRFPIFDAYGKTHEFLDEAETVAATVEGRIKSVWPFIVSRVLEFSRTLKGRERINFDPEDILTELWVVLADKDALWTPERGKYITFVGIIIDREFSSIRDKARTIHSPRNSSCRMKKYREEEEGGTISDRRAKTAADIRRTGAGPKDLCLDSHNQRTTSLEPISVMAGSEKAAENLDAISKAVRRLSPFEAYVVGRLIGLWGRSQSSVWLIAWETGREQVEVRRASDRAKLKIRKHLNAIRHPVTTN